MKRNLFISSVFFLLLILLFGCSTTDVGVRTISVTGSSTLFVNPDCASFTVTFESIKSTTEEARNASSSLISSAIETIKDEFGITDDEITTAYMVVSPYYEWIDGVRTLSGQKASQSIDITIKNNTHDIGKVYDRLSVLDGISISSISYSKLDTTLDYERAREEASKTALKKAESYAKGLGLNVGNVFLIEEGGATYSSPYLAKNAVSLEMDALTSSYSPTQYYASLISISANVVVVFELVE